MFFMKQREVKADAQQQKRHHGHRKVNDQLQPLRDVRDIDESEPGVDGHHRGGEPGQCGPHVSRMLMGLAGRAGEPQRRTDQPSDGGGGHRHRYPADARLDEQRRDRAGAGHHARGELWRQPRDGRGGSEGQRAEGPDHEAVQRLPIRRPQQAYHHHRHEHEQHAADRYAESVLEEPARRYPGAERDPVRPGYRRTGQQHPADPERDPESSGQKKSSDGKVVIGIRLPQVQQEQQRKPKRGNGDQRRGHP